MEVILLSDVDHVGLRGNVVSVARGYARNYLLPRQLAEEATSARVAELQKRDTLRARHEAKTADEAQEIAQALAQTVLRFEVKAGPTCARARPTRSIASAATRSRSGCSMTSRSR